MNVENLNELMSLDNASLAKKRDDIAKLVEDYPYSGPFRMLLAKASKEAREDNCKNYRLIRKRSTRSKESNSNYLLF